MLAIAENDFFKIIHSKYKLPIDNSLQINIMNELKKKLDFHEDYLNQTKVLYFLFKKNFFLFKFN
jgi:hypothetical protein